MGKKITFTPGPWKAQLNKLKTPVGIFDGHMIVADNDAESPISALWEGGGSIGKPRQIANAHLIAAAPELLGALKECRAALAAGYVTSQSPLAELMDSYDALIAKAEGNAS